MEGLRVLVVDDEAELVDTMVERLKLRGIEAEGATSGEEALVRLLSTSFQVVVLDVKMPGLGGLEVFDQIRRQHPDTQVVLLTGHGSTEDAERGMGSGAFDYLMKPVNIEDLIKILRLAAAR